MNTAQKTIALSWLIGMLFIGNPLIGQEALSDSLQEQLQPYLDSLRENYQVKDLNLAPRRLGGIDQTQFSGHYHFMLKARKKTRNKLGQMRREKRHHLLFEYATERDRQYALQFWMDDFIEQARVRRGRRTRKIEGAKPTLILINPRSIIIGTQDCKFYQREAFEEWKESLLKAFGQPATMVIEIACDGPLEWTRNAPDPRSRGLF